MAIGLSRSSTRATELRWPILCFWESSMASTMGTDILTNDPSPIRSELKWRVWRNSDSLMNPFNGLAQPSLSTWTHWISIFEILIEGKDKASLVFASFWDLSTKSSTSFPPSGSINPQETRILIRLLEVDFWGNWMILTDGTKWVFWVLVKKGDWVGFLRKREDMVAIDEMETERNSSLSFSLSSLFNMLSCYPSRIDY